MNGFIVSVFLILSTILQSYVLIMGLQLMKSGWVMYILVSLAFLLTVCGCGLYLQHEWTVHKKEKK